MIAALSTLKATAVLITPRRFLYLIVAVAIGFLTWKAVAFVDAKYQAEAEVVTLQQQLSARDEAIEILNDSIDQREMAQKKADESRVLIDTRRESIEEIRRSAASAKEEDNGALAPVLRDALRSLDGLQ